MMAPDQRVRTGGRQAQIPGAEVPDDGRNQQGEDHRESSARPDIKHQFDGQQREHSEGYGAAGSQNPDQIPAAGPYHGDQRLKGVSVNDRGNCVGCVVKSVHELKAKGHAQSQQEKNPTSN